MTTRNEQDMIASGPAALTSSPNISLQAFLLGVTFPRLWLRYRTDRAAETAERIGGLNVGWVGDDSSRGLRQGLRMPSVPLEAALRVPTVAGDGLGVCLCV